MKVTLRSKKRRAQGRYAVIAALVVIGTVLLISTHALTPTASLEAEDGLATNTLVDSDLGSSSGGAVRFGAAGLAGLPNFIDTTTSYEPPAGAVFVAPNGLDTNAGTKDQPLKTICHAMSKVTGTGTIVLRGGIYREGYDGSSYSSDCGDYNLNTGVTIQGYQKERAWVKGSKVVTSWTSDGSGHYKVSWPALARLASRAVANDAVLSNVVINPGSMAGDAAQVFINGASLKQVDQLDKVAAASATAPATFFADRTTNIIYLKDNPAGKVAEVTDSVRFLQISGVNAAIKGVGFAQFATTWDPSVYPGAIVLLGTGAHLENTVFTQNAAGGMSMYAANGTLSSSLITKNGGLGVVGNRTDNSIIEKNIVSFNNAEDFALESCQGSCTMAGIKLARTSGVQVRDNVFDQNNGAGFWCDLNCKNAVIVRNVASQNKEAGIFYEVSSGGIIASNLIRNNGDHTEWKAGLSISADNVKVYNNTFVDNFTNVYVYDDSRSSQTNSNDIGPDTAGIIFKNNLLSGGSNMVLVRWVAGGQNGPEDYFSAYNYNAYFRKNGVPANIIEWGAKGSSASSNYTSLSAFSMAHQFDINGLENTAATNPYFVDDVSKNYKVRDGSPARSSSESLPADVAAAIGVSTSVQDRGALLWPGR